MTLEAAFVLPVFTLFLVGFLYFLLLIGFQMRLQQAMDEVTGQMVMISGASGVNTDLEGEIQTVVAEQTVKGMMEGHVPFVRGGTQGLNFSESRVEEEGQFMDLVVNYTVIFPLGLLGGTSFSFVQRSCRRIWSGSEGTSWQVDAPEEETVYVYITESGMVYHLFADCSYLKLSIERVERVAVSQRRSQDGSRYYPCQFCQGDGSGGYVYITGYGNRYHSTLTCRELSRSVTVVPIEEVGSMPVCSRCRER